MCMEGLWTPRLTHDHRHPHCDFHSCMFMSYQLYQKADLFSDIFYIYKALSLPQTDVVLPFEERAKVSQAMAHDLQTARKCYVPEATAQQARGTALNILKSLMTSVKQKSESHFWCFLDLVTIAMMSSKCLMNCTEKQLPRHDVPEEPMQTMEEAGQQGQTQAQGILKDDLEVSTSSDDSEDEEGKTMDQETLAESEVSESADSCDFEDEGQVREVMVQGQEQAQSESCSSEPDSSESSEESQESGEPGEVSRSRNSDNIQD